MSSVPVGPFLFEGDRAAAEGDHDTARATYQAIADAGDDRAWALLGDLALTAPGSRVGPESDDEEQSEALAFYRRGAEAGDPAAALRLGDALADANRSDEAVEWYDRAADAGFANAGAKAGRLRWEAGDRAGAESRWRRSLESGSDVGALVGLADVMLADEQPVAAVGYAIRAALAARHQLVGTDAADFAYEVVPSGPGTELTARNLEAAIDLVNEYRLETLEAAEAGDAEACWHWGRIEQLGFGQLPDLEEGQRWIERAADAGHPEASAALARIDRQNGNVEQFERRLRVAAEAGLPGALHDLAFALYSGAFGGEPDIDGAIEAYRAAAGPTHPTSATDLSFVLEDQAGPEAAEESLRWLRVAANARDVAAMRRLGERLRDGEGVEVDAAAALDWFMAAYYAGWTDGLETLRDVASELDARTVIDADRRAGGSGLAAALLLDDPSVSSAASTN